jgi:uncharacterized protein (DUF885 family)
LRRILILLAVVTVLQGSCWSPMLREDGVAAPNGIFAGEDRFTEFSRQYLAWFFSTHPVRATQLGIHDHDHALPAMDRRGIERLIAESREWLERLEAIDPDRLDLSASFDHQILDHAIRAELLDLEEIESWKHNPLLYNRAIADGVASLVERDFAPLETRIENLIERLDAVPGVIAAAKQNLDDVPRLWAELSARSSRATAEYLVVEVSTSLREQGLEQLDPELRRRWTHTQRRAARRLQQFAVWMNRDLTPLADGDFRLGRRLFERKLLYEEHVDLTADQLHRMNEDAIDDYREWVAREAARVDPRSPVDVVMAGIVEDHPRPEELIPAARRFVEQARQFVERRQIVTLPTDGLPEIRPTPEFARSGFASMSTPGPFETRSTRAFYNITNVDPAWSARHQSEHLTYFNYPALLGISIHEVMPGHYVHLMWRDRLPTDVRKVFLPASVVEGWAHYVEQMMVDEGLGDGDPAVRLGQLRRALQRHARWDAGLGMHVFDASVEEAANRFREIAYFPEFPALREAQRGTYNPTYLVYALGRMEILRLREDYRAYLAARGEEFSLREFHDRFLMLGLPISLAREAMMPDPAHLSQSGSGSTPRPSAKRS